MAASAGVLRLSLGPIGARRNLEFGDVIGYGVPPMPDFQIGPRTSGDGFREAHIAFSAPDRGGVHAFFEAGKSAHAEVLHEPRVWPEYHPNYQVPPRAGEGAFPAADRLLADIAESAGEFRLVPPRGEGARPQYAADGVHRRLCVPYCVAKCIRLMG